MKLLVLFLMLELFTSLDGRSTGGCFEAYLGYKAYHNSVNSLCAAKVSAKTIGGLFQTPNMFIPGLMHIALDGDWLSEGINDTNTTPSGVNCSDRSACESLGLAHEHAKCFITEEETTNYARQTLTTNRLTKWQADRRMAELKPGVNVTVAETSLLPGCNDIQVACHPIDGNDCRLIFCHTITNTKVYNVKVVADDGSTKQPIPLIAVCHRDTSMWDKHHVSFNILHKQPGDGTICHFIYYNDAIYCPRV